MKVFVSQPMSGIDNDTVIDIREECMDILKKYYAKKNIDIEYDPASKYLKEDKDKEKDLFTNNPEVTKKRISMFYFLRSIQYMVGKDAIIFLDGWEYSRGCILEYFIAKAFGLKILGEFTSDGFSKSIGNNRDITVLMNLFKYFKQNEGVY